MLKLYHSPLSPNSRRVWIALLEKDIPFELVLLNHRSGDQFKPEFLAINPFHHVPVLVDDGFSVVESLAILDYLEAKYPTPALMPTDAKAVATVRMVEMVTVNELMPATRPLFYQLMGLEELDPQKQEQAKQQSATVLLFFERLLGNHPYFGGEHFTLAEVVAGTVVPQLPNLGISIDDFPQIFAWSQRLMERAAWAKTQPTPEAWVAFKTQIQAEIAERQTH